MKPLSKFKVVSLALNLPGPLAVHQLQQKGAKVVKIEPPSGDPLKLFNADWYEQLHQGQQVLTSNLKKIGGQEQLFEHLKEAHLLITASRPKTLEKLGITDKVLKDKFPNLNTIFIVAYSGQNNNKAGHDLNFQADLGFLEPPNNPKFLWADYIGAERVFSQALLLFLSEIKGQVIEMALADLPANFKKPLKLNLTHNKGILGGALAQYANYQCKDDSAGNKTWIALGALEPSFSGRLQKEFNLEKLSKKALQDIFATKTAQTWEDWGVIVDIPITVIKSVY